MITDVFFKRYPNDRLPLRQEDLEFFRRIDLLISNEIIPRMVISPFDQEAIWRNAHNSLAMELGRHALADNIPAHSITYIPADKICRTFLFDVPRDAQKDTRYVGRRLSLIELLFSNIERSLDQRIEDIENSAIPASYSDEQRESQRAAHEAFCQRIKAVREQAVTELNYRLRETYTDIVLEYHNGKIQHADDLLIAATITLPFWSLLKTKKWQNPDSDMKRAFDHRDNDRPNEAILASAHALESTIKIISDEKRWTRGNENGAANFLDNLAKDGRFVKEWEKQGLLSFFRLRNTVGHGAGSKPSPSYTIEQTDHIIEQAMSWIKLLVRRI
jgi:hypothetical protein